MNRDPLYQKIVEALSKPLDGNAFERCASSLLGKVHPNLAPMPGGDDAGMDGGFGTPDGPFPLICTVQSDVIGNVRGNLTANLAKRKGPKLATVATSQTLSNPQKRRIEEAARELGVTVTNIYDGPYFSDQLYRNPSWRRELLGVSGAPSALSALPRVGRFAQPKVLIGREEDLDWLQGVKGDCLIVGHPGSGKTYLHQYLAEQGGCLFAVDDSQERLADAIREQSPSIIVVDDAHIHVGLVEVLNRLRTQVDASYDIHLNCWPSHEAAVQKALNIPNRHVRRLRPLRRPEIFELIRELGIDGPDWLQDLIISNADGKPGLATALAELCKVDDLEHIWSGEAVTRQLLGDLRLVRNEKERCVLGAFSVGGDSGMTFGDVSMALGLPILDLRQITADLGAGGLIEEVPGDRIQVRPPAIRAVLVRDVFYGGATSPPISPLLNRISSRASTASVLLSAKQRGADIDYGLLELYVTSSDRKNLWEHFAWVDAHCANLILDSYPDRICDAAPGLLSFWPKRTVHELLDADNAVSVPEGAIQHPRRRISEWLFPIGNEDLNITIERRVLLLSVLNERVLQNRIGNGASFTWALSECLKASFHVARKSPRSNREVRSIRGVAPLEILKKIAQLWPDVRGLLCQIPNSTARTFFSAIENWCFPQRFSMDAPLPDGTHEFVRSVGRQMLSDFLEMPHCNRAWRNQAANLAKWTKLGLDVDVDPVYDAIYADRDHSEDWQLAYQRRVERLQAIAATLMKSPMEQVLSDLADIRQEAVEFESRNSNGYQWIIYQHIAQNCLIPSEWLLALVARNSPIDFVAPFLDRVLLEDQEEYKTFLKRLLLIPGFRELAIGRILFNPDLNEDLLSTAVGLLDNPDLTSRWSFQGLSAGVMLRLLRHGSSFVRAAAALAEWSREPVGTIRSELEVAWRIAIRDVGPDESQLEQIFEKLPDLAFQWIEGQLNSNNNRLSEHSWGLVGAVKYLTKDERLRTLRLLNRENYSDDVFDLVLGEQTELFADWLKFAPDEYLRLRPLDRDISVRWEQMALIALNSGMSPGDLAEHCMPRHFGGNGELSEYFTERVAAYEALANHREPRFRIAGKRGMDFMSRRAKRETENERREEIDGY